MVSAETDTATEPNTETVEDKVAAWLDDNWDLDLTLGEWWQRLADSAYAHPSPPAEAGGRGYSQSEALRVMRVLADHKVVGPPPGLDYKLAAPTIAELALHASAPSIYGGSDEIQRNILCERTLGLPKEPGPSRDTPFTELVKNG